MAPRAAAGSSSPLHLTSPPAMPGRACPKRPSTIARTFFILRVKERLDRESAAAGVRAVRQVPRAEDQRRVRVSRNLNESGRRSRWLRGHRPGVQRIRVARRADRKSHIAAAVLPASAVSGGLRFNLRCRENHIPRSTRRGRDGFGSSAFAAHHRSHRAGEDQCSAAVPPVRGRVVLELVVVCAQHGDRPFKVRASFGGVLSKPKGTEIMGLSRSRGGNATGRFP